MKKILKAIGAISIFALLSACAAYVSPYPAGGTYCRYHPRHGAYRCHYRPYRPYHPFYPPYHPYHPYHPWHHHRHWR